MITHVLLVCVHTCITSGDSKFSNKVTDIGNISMHLQGKELLKTDSVQITFIIHVCILIFYHMTLYHYSKFNYLSTKFQVLRIMVHIQYNLREVQWKFLNTSMIIITFRIIRAWRRCVVTLSGWGYTLECSTQQFTREINHGVF